jgi:catechol 2,3-dioxygenase-like lactoylglutathione lyase family enzyme
MITPVRRLAIATSKTEECVRFYSDVLGLRKFYDNVMTNAPGVKSLLGPEGRFSQRLVSMQMGDSAVGMMGFLEYLDASFTVKPFAREPGGPFRIAAEFIVSDVASVVGKVRRNGAVIIGGPLDKSLPEGVASAVTFTDPNGVLVQAVSCPDNRAGQSPSPIRRVVIPVANGKADAAARLYHEALGMSVLSDETYESPEAAAIIGLAGKARVRLITLKQEQKKHGMVGFMEFLKPAFEIQPFVKKENYPYEVVLVFVIDDMDSVLSKALALGGQLMGRRTYEVPGRGMVEGAMLTDMNGVVIDLTRWLEPQML